MLVGTGLVIGDAVPLPRFATILSSAGLDRLVIDKTNLAGRFDIQLRWAPDSRGSPSDPGGTSSSATFRLPVNFHSHPRTIGIETGIVTWSD
jgi:uncharacterized protein (TIGR03435 family)